MAISMSSINHADLGSWLRQQGAIGLGMFDRLVAYGHNAKTLEGVIKNSGITIGDALRDRFNSSAASTPAPPPDPLAGVNHGDIGSWLKQQGSIGAGMFDRLVAFGHDAKTLESVVRGANINIGERLQARFNTGQPQTTNGWTPNYSSILGYNDKPALTTYENGQWVYGKDAYGTPYQRYTGTTDKTGKPVYRTEVPDLKAEARSAYEERQREQMRILAQQRQAVAQQQVRDLEAMQKQMAQQTADQNQRVSDLQAQQDKRLSDLSEESAAEQLAIRTAGENKARRIRNAGNAAAASLRVLARGQTQQAPSAQQSPRAGRRRGTGRTAAAVARGSGATRGTNLSI